MQLKETQRKILEKLDPKMGMDVSTIAKKLKSLPGPMGRCMRSLIEKGYAKGKDGKYTRTGEGTKALKN
jgi:predicted ArsR family transcriptional regulator